MQQKPIPYGKQEITEADIEAVIKVLKGDYLTQGPTIEKFERELAERCGARYVVALANGTVALHLAYLALGLKAGQKLATSPISFVATANAALYCGAEVHFCDVDPQTYNLSVDSLIAALAQDTSIVGVAPVHMGGVPCAMETIAAIAREKNLWIVEDACHAVGTKWIDSTGQERRVGDCSYSDMTIFSFHPVKQIAAGEGGAITTNNFELYKLLLKLRTHGITKDPAQLRANHGGWYYEMQELGFNFRITDIQCALAASQLSRLDDIVQKRRTLLERYHTAFADLTQISMQRFNKDDGISFHLAICQAKHRDELYRFLQRKGIFAQVHYIPIYQQPYYQQRYDINPAKFPNAEGYYQKALSLPLYPTLSFAEQDYVIAAVKEFYRDY